MSTASQLGTVQAFVLEGNHSEPMSPEEFANIRSRLAWTQLRMSTWLGVTEQMINGYEGGRFPIPPGRANHLRLTALCLEI